MKDILKGMGLSIATIVAMLVLWFTLPASEPPFVPEQIMCFPMPSTRGMLPTVKPRLLRADDPDSILSEKRIVMQTHQSSVFTAAQTCTTEKCEPADFKKYRSSIFFYVATRETIARNLFRERGDSGLSLAHDIFDTDGDREVVSHLQSLVQAGKFDLSVLGETRQSAALLTYKPASGYVPCADENS